MKRSNHGFFLCIATVCSLWVVFSHNIARADTNGWPTPINISQTPGLNSAYPRITIDRAQGIHVVWSEGSVPSEELNPDTIMYTYLDSNGVWTVPVDIIADSEFALAMNLIAREDELYLLWVGSKGNLYLSIAPVTQATSVKAWSTYPVPTSAPIRSADMVWDEEGCLYIAQVNQNGSIQMISSVDEGMTFSYPMSVWMPPSESINVSGVRTSVAAHVLHLVWTMNSEEIDWNSYGIGYIRSLDGGNTWQDTWTVNDLGDDGNVIVDGYGNIHVMWNRTAGGGSRVHRWSSDQGKSWSSIDYRWQGAIGRTGFPGLAIDSHGDLHLFTSNDLGVGLHHAIWHNGVWSGLEDVIPPNIVRGERPWIAIAGGNILHAVYMTFGDYEIWYTVRKLDAPYIPADLIPTSTPALSELTATPTVSPTPITIAERRPYSTTVDANTFLKTEVIVLVSIALPLLIVIGVLLGQTYARRMKT